MEPETQTPATAEGGAGAGGAGQLVSWIAGAAVLAVALSLIWAGDSGVPAPVGRGAQAPDFTLQRLDGDEPFVLAEERGRIVLVNFWATWCKPCEDEIPSMERLYRALHPQGLELVAISVDEGRDEVAAFRDRLGVTFPIALDPSQEVSRLYQTTGYPESLLVDRDGTILERYVGPRDWSVYRERIESLLAGTP